MRRQASEAIDRHIRHAVHAGSSIYHLDETLLRDLEPDLIVTQELCEVCAVAYTQVERAARRLPGEVPVVSLEPLTLAEICATVRTVGRLSGHQAEAETVAVTMEARIAAVGSLVRPQPRPRVACIEWTAPLMAGGHWVPDMVEVAGGIDCLGTTATPSRYVTWPELVAAQPDLLVLMPCGYDLDHTMELAREVVSRPEFFRPSSRRHGTRRGGRRFQLLQPAGAEDRRWPGDPGCPGPCGCRVRPPPRRELGAGMTSTAELG